MQDRPTYDELLHAVERFLDDLVESSDGAQRFNARVSANVLRIVRRELAHKNEHLELEWASLDELLGASTAERSREAIAARNEELSARIRAGDADDGSFRNAALAHLRRTVRDKLIVTNPGWAGEEGS